MPKKCEPASIITTDFAPLATPFGSLILCLSSIVATSPIGLTRLQHFLRSLILSRRTRHAVGQHPVFQRLSRGCSSTPTCNLGEAFAEVAKLRLFPRFRQSRTSLRALGP